MFQIRYYSDLTNLLYLDFINTKEGWSLEPHFFCLLTKEVKKDILCRIWSKGIILTDLFKGHPNGTFRYVRKGPVRNRTSCIDVVHFRLIYQYLYQAAIYLLDVLFVEQLNADISGIRKVLMYLRSYRHKVSNYIRYFVADDSLFIY